MVFGFFKKKQDPTKVAIDVISNLLQLQFALGGNDVEQLVSDNFSLGYIFGLHDGIFQAMDINNQAEGFAVMTMSYIQLMGDQSTGVEILRKSLNLQNDQTFMKGMFAGGEDAVKFINEKGPPLGLSSHLLSRGS